MKVTSREAVTLLRKNLDWWKLRADGGDTMSWVDHDCAIPVAETLLAALERIDLDVLEGLRPQSVYLSPPAERPPEPGDWVFRSFLDMPHKVVRVKAGRVDQVLWTDTQVVGNWLKDETTGRTIIVRRAADRLRVKDRVAFGSEKGWIHNIIDGEAFGVNFTNKGTLPLAPGSSHGYFPARDLTLVEPVYDRPAEKDY